MSLRRTTKAWLRPIYRRILKPIYSTLRRPFANGHRENVPAAASEVAVAELVSASARHEAALQQILAALIQLPRLDQIPQPLPAPPFSRALYVGQERLLFAHPTFPFMYLDAQDPLVTPRVLLGSYEPGVTAALKRLLKPGAVVVEAGANQGYHTLTMAALVCPGGGRVVSVEANPRAFAVLQDTVFGLGLRDLVTLYQKAAYHEQATLQLHLGRSTAHSSLVYSPGGGGTIAVEGVRLGDLLRALGLRPTFVRLDIEGAEPQALAGMWEYLESVPEITLLFEFFPGLINVARYTTAGAFLERLMTIGFKFWLIGDDGSLTPAGLGKLIDPAAPARVDLVAARALP